MSGKRQSGTVRREEELDVGTRIAPVGNVHAEKHIDVEKVGRDLPRDVEHAVVDRVAAGEGDSGQVETLPDGSISIPVLEEELVVSKRVVGRERIVLRKEVATETQRVDSELRRERVDVTVYEDGRGGAA